MVGFNEHCYSAGMLFPLQKSMGLALAMFCCACGGTADAPPVGPSVLLVTLDTTRADRLGCYGYAAAKTPNLDALARDGIRFDHAIAPVPLTLPSHATLLSGVHPGAHGVHINQIGAVHPDVHLLSEEFQDRGFRTGAFLASWVLHEKFGLARGFDAYEDVEGKDSRRPGNEVVDDALAWLDGAPEAPFFAWVHLFDAHDPYLPPPGFRAGFEHPYDGELAFVDAQVGRLLAWLEACDLDGETIVVIAGDHGESLGEHEEDTHGIFLYDSTMRVPLILRGPDISAGTVVDSVVGIVDVAPTLYELLDWPVPAAIEGRSLARAFAGEPLETFPLFLESEYAMTYGWAPLAAVVTDEWKFVEAPRPELYRLGAEDENLTEQYPEVLARLREVLDTHRSRAVMREANNVTLSASEEANLGALGYVGAARDERLQEALNSGGLDDPKDHMEDLRARIVQQSMENWSTRAGSLVASGRFADAVAAIGQRDRLGDPTPTSLCMLGDALLGLRRLEEANLSYQAALKMQPDRGQTHSRIGKMLAQYGDIDQAIVHFKKYVELDPESANAHTNLANALFRKLRVVYRSGAGSFSIEDFKPGIAHLRTALKHAPGFSPAHIALVAVYTDTGRPGEALAAMRAAAIALPNDSRHTGGLAWRLATAADARAEDAGEALELAQAAVSADPNSATTQDILGAAYAHAGNFPKAMESAQRALGIAREEHKAELISAIEARLVLYQLGRAFRTP